MVWMHLESKIQSFITNSWSKLNENSLAKRYSLANVMLMFLFLFTEF
jgi:hypothetical protein